MRLSGLKSAYVLRRYRRILSSVTAAYLSESLRACSEADIALKSSRAPREQILELLVGRLMR